MSNPVEKGFSSSISKINDLTYQEVIKTSKGIQVMHGTHVIASSRNTIQVKIREGLFVYLIPKKDVDFRTITASKQVYNSSIVGSGNNLQLKNNDKQTFIGFQLNEPKTEFANYKKYCLFFVNKADACFVDGIKAKISSSEQKEIWSVSRVSLSKRF